MVLTRGVKTMTIAIMKRLKRKANLLPYCNAVGCKKKRHKPKNKNY